MNPNECRELLEMNPYDGGNEYRTRTSTMKDTGAETKAQMKAETYDCECIDCGHKMQSDEHCQDIKCPECGGTMRRAERPGPGQGKGNIL